eukprot:s4357_g5.t1
MIHGRRFIAELQICAHKVEWTHGTRGPVKFGASWATRSRWNGVVRTAMPAIQQKMDHSHVPAAMWDPKSSWKLERSSRCTLGHHQLEPHEVEIAQVRPKAELAPLVFDGWQRPP